MNKEQIIEDLLKSPLTYQDRTIIQEILSGKRKLVFGDTEVSAIIAKLNEYEKLKKSMSKKEMTELVEKKMDSIDREIDCLEDEIRNFESQKDEYERFISTL